MAAGDKVPWSYIATRVATTTITADSSTWTTTETSISTVVASLTSGLLYRVQCCIPLSSGSAGELMNLRIREDTVAGTQLQGINVYASTTSAVGFQGYVVAEYTAVATGSKTFVLTGSRVTSLGTCQARAGASRPAYFTVDLIPS
jgi:hypothetical protein